MVLHTTFAGLNVSTTGGTTYDAVGAANFFPTGDIEIQTRGGTLPQLIGFDAMMGDTTPIGAGSVNYDFFDFRCNTWPSADYVHFRPMKGAYSAAAKSLYGCGDGQPIWNLPGVQMDHDADWDVRVNSTTASMTVVGALYLSYGQRYPYKGGQLVTRTIDFAGGTDGAYPAEGTKDTVTDLDPRYIYRVAGVQVSNVENQKHIGIYITSSSNNTTIGTLHGSVTDTTYHAMMLPVWLPHDSILIAGNETVAVGSFSEVAQNPTAEIFFEKYGKVGEAIGSKAPRVTGVPKTGAFGKGGIGSILQGLRGA